MPMKINVRVSRPKIRSLGVHLSQSDLRSRMCLPSLCRERKPSAEGLRKRNLLPGYLIKCRGSFAPQRYLQIAAELADEIDGDAGMDAALLVVEAGALADRE